MNNSIESFLIFVYVVFIAGGVVLLLNAVKTWLAMDVKTARIKFWISVILLLFGILIAYICKMIK